MRSKRQSYIVISTLLILFLTGCRTLQRGAQQESIDSKQKKEMLLPLSKPHSDLKALTSKISVSLDYNQHTCTVKGRLRMRYDEVVQMSITALGVVEVAFIECTPKAAYIIDRINKRYTQFNYSTGLLSSSGINFYTIQALFWNRLFIPGEEYAWEHTDKFEIIPMDNSLQIEPSAWNLLKCSFRTNNECTQLQQTELSLKHYKGTWHYDQFQSTGFYTWPVKYNISLSGTTQTIGAHITLSSLTPNDTNWKTGTNLSNYKEVELKELLSLLNILK